jgi:hypothetical protein
VVSIPSRFEPLPRGVAGTLRFQDGASRDGLGECVVEGDGDGGIVIVRADPRVAVSGVLLRDWHEGTPGYITLECAGDPDHIGDVVRFDGANRRVVYAIRCATDPVNDVWEARWPD